MDRSDGRSENTLRQLSCELGCLKNCDGSAQWKSGHTAVLAAVHGPIAPRQAQYEDSANCIVSVVVKSGATTVTEREWEGFLTKQLTACIMTKSYPRCVISIVLQILNADGSVLAAALHAAVSALMDAGIDMKTLPTAVTCRCLDNYFQLDPAAEEERDADAVLLLVFPSHATADKCVLLGCHTTASIKQPAVQALNCCTTAARAVPAVQAFWRLAIEQKVTRESQTLWSS
jgi:ribonuclease PH